MGRSKLFRRIEKITKQEWKPLLNYLKGSVGEGNDPYKLFEYIYNFRKNLEDSRLQLEEVNLAVFPHLSKKSFQNVMSVLSSHIESFWVWWDLFHDEKRLALQHFRSLNRRGLYDETGKLYKKLKSKLSNPGDLDLWNAFYLYKISHERHFSYSPLKSDKTLARDNYKTMITSIREFVTDIMEYYEAEVYNLQSLYNEDWSEELEMIQNSKFAHEETILYKSLIAQKDLVESRYQVNPDFLFTCLREGGLDISQELKLTYYVRLRRYLILRTRMGDVEAREKLLELIWWSVDSGLIIFSGRLDEIRFIGDLNILCSLKEIEKSRKYYHHFSKFLVSKDIEDITKFGLMLIEFSCEDYDKVIQIYSTHHFIMGGRRLQAMGLFLRASYELYGSDAEYFDMFIRNYKDFIRRNKDRYSETQLTSRKNFIMAFKHLVDHQIDEVHQLLLGAVDVMHRSWLNEKVKVEFNR